MARSGGHTSQLIIGRGDPQRPRRIQLQQSTSTRCLSISNSIRTVFDGPTCPFERKIRLVYCEQHSTTGEFYEINASETSGPSNELLTELLPSPTIYQWSIFGK